MRLRKSAENVKNVHVNTAIYKRKNKTRLE